MDKWRIKKGDTVKVISGDDKGICGEILSVDRKNRRVIVKGVNVVTRHQKPSASNAGGLIKKEKSVHASNVMFMGLGDDKPTRIGMKMINGEKVRYSKRSGSVIN
jgi:large subunit ribosomal protein L24